MWGSSLDPEAATLSKVSSRFYSVVPGQFLKLGYELFLTCAFQILCFEDF
jgi:hypothetical protein